MSSYKKFWRNKRGTRVSYILGCIAIFIAACNSERSVTSPIDIHPTQSPISKTVTPIYSKTPEPSNTPAPLSTNTATPTLDSLTILASEFDVPTVCLFTYLVSNDQNWIAAHCPITKELIIANKFAENKLSLPYQEIEKETLNNFSTHPLSWSSDNRYLYFTTRCCNYDDSLNSNGSLYRFDIENETWSILVRAIYEPYYFFSDDGERYVYLNHYPWEGSDYHEQIEIGMVDVLSNKSKRVVLDYYSGLRYIKPEYEWSSNSDEFSIILEKIVTIHPHTIGAEEVRLKINFRQWYMEIVE